MKRSWLLLGCLIVLGVLSWYEPSRSVRGWVRGEPFFAGRSVSAWEQALTSEDPATHAQALKELSEGGESASAVLCTLALRRSAAPEVRCDAVEQLGKSGGQSDRVRSHLLQALQDPDPHVQTLAAEAVAKVNTEAERAVPALTKLLDVQATVPTIRALSTYGEQAKPALDRLVAIMQDRALPSEVRWNAVRTIGKMRAAGLDAVPALIPLMKDEEPTVREHAAEAIGDIGPLAKDAIPALVETLEDSFYKARRDAVRSLGQLGPVARSALPEIEKRLEDSEAIVREAARTAIERVSGEPPAPTDAPEKGKP